MPKDSRCRSRGRKPLVDISNGAKMARTSKKVAPGDGGGGFRDRLLHARSELSELFHQIDKLVMQALEHKFIIGKNQEIEAFIHVLSDMHLSLRAWIPRLEQAFGSNLSGGPGNHLELSLDNKTFSVVDAGKKSIFNGPSEPELGFIVSPSPLVSWRNGTCTVESGRKLFLLTPLHESKSVASKFSRSSKCFQGRLSNNENSSCSTVRLATFSNAPSSSCGNQLEKIDEKLATEKTLVPGTGVSDSTDGASENNFVPLARSSNFKHGFVDGFSPSFKISPLKTCFLLDSGSDSIQQDNKVYHKGTPWVARPQRNNASPLSVTLSSGKHSQKCGSDENSTILTSKYPELFGMPPAQNSTVWRKEVDETLDWFLSPPKTCVLLESLDEKVVLPSGTGREKCPLNSGKNNLKLAGPEATPTWKDLENTTANGNNAGEATLKRELWTKFEAVSMNGLQSGRSNFHQISRNLFLDMLEEVS